MKRFLAILACFCGLLPLEAGLQPKDYGRLATSIPAAAAGGVTWVSATATNYNTGIGRTNDLLMATTDSGANRVLVVHEMGAATVTLFVATNVSWKGLALTKLAETSHTDFGIDGSIWYLLNPPANTTTNFIIEYESALGTYTAATGFYLTGAASVDGFQGWGTGDPTTGHTNTVTSTTSSVVLDAFFLYDKDVGTTITTRSPLTERATANASNMYINGNTAPGAASVSCGTALSASEGRAGQISCSVNP